MGVREMDKNKEKMKTKKEKIEKRNCSSLPLVNMKVVNDKMRWEEFSNSYSKCFVINSLINSELISEVNLK